MREREIRCWLACCVAAVLVIGPLTHVEAQAGPAAAPPPAAAAPAAPAAPTPAPRPPEVADTLSAAPAQPTADTAPAAAAPAVEPACFPSCRSGFLCSAGQCISACNPGCAAGERCTAAAECEPSLPAPPAAYLDARPLPPPPPPAPEVGVHTHDGFLLRATLGFGGGAMTESYRGDAFGAGSTGGEIEYAGGGFRLSLDVGGALSPALSVHGRLSVGTLNEPSTFIDGADYETPQGTAVTASLLGVGVTYVIMPLNLYFAGVLGIAGISVSDEDEDTEDAQGESDAGPGVELDVGKEWWIGPQLGLGLALRLSFAASDYNGELYDSDRTWLGAGLVCSLTYQ